MKAKFTNVSIPSELAEAIDKFIKESKMGFKSRASVVNFAVRVLLLS